MITLILAGGKSIRMGRAKALIERPDGTRQLDHIIELARRVSPDVLVSTNSPEIVTEGTPILPDLHPGAGPLGALASFHAAYPEEPVLLLGCDLFLLDEDSIRHLMTHHSSERSSSCFANRIDKRPCCIDLSQSKFVVITIIQSIAEIA